MIASHCLIDNHCMPWIHTSMEVSTAVLIMGLLSMPAVPRLLARTLLTAVALFTKLSILIHCPYFFLLCSYHPTTLYISSQLPPLQLSYPSTVCFVCVLAMPSLSSLSSTTASLLYYYIIIFIICYVPVTAVLSYRILYSLSLSLSLSLTTPLPVTYNSHI
jgi:hypothetical protein